MTKSRLAWFVGLAFASSPSLASTELLDWADLYGWDRDDHAIALQVFQETCRDLKDGDWPAICAISSQVSDPKAYFETFFRPVLITDDAEPLFTGYYEPEFPGSRARSPEYDVPIYRLPNEAPLGRPWLTRQQIETSDVLKDRDLEIVWLKNRVDKFFLQVQGSGRINLAEGGVVRLGYGGKNGHPYRSIGRELVRRGTFLDHQVSAEVIRNWIEKNPTDGEELMFHNPSYVFFREVNQVPAEKGPLGAMNRSITAGRSVAIDPEFVPLGAPVWLEKEGAAPIQRLMIAQDTGAAINGAQRADIFYGTGPDAGREAGRIRDGGRLIVLLPIEDALSLTSTDQ